MNSPRVIIDVSPSLDGFLAGPQVSVDKPFGTAGHRLYQWHGSVDDEPTAADRDAAAGMFTGTGAIVLGRRMFEVGIGHWGEDGAFERPCFVVTNRPHEKVLRGPTTFTFVTGGAEQTVERAREAAGGGNVVIVGGAEVVRQCLAAKLVDEIRLHVNHVLLGGGARMFPELPDSVELTRTDVVATDHATHLTFRVDY